MRTTTLVIFFVCLCLASNVWDIAANGFQLQHVTIFILGGLAIFSQWHIRLLSESA